MMSACAGSAAPLGAALSKVPLKYNAAAENDSGSRTKSAKEFLSRKERKGRKEMEDGNELMEGGNEATIGSGITHSPLGEQTVRIVHTKSTKPKTSPGCSPSSGYLAETRINLFRNSPPPPRWIAAVSAAEEN